MEEQLRMKRFAKYLQEEWEEFEENVEITPSLIFLSHQTYDYFSIINSDSTLNYEYFTLYYFLLFKLRSTIDPKLFQQLLHTTNSEVMMKYCVNMDLETSRIISSSFSSFSTQNLSVVLLIYFIHKLYDENQISFISNFKIQMKNCLFSEQLNNNNKNNNKNTQYKSVWDIDSDDSFESYLLNTYSSYSPNPSLYFIYFQLVSNFYSHYSPINYENNNNNNNIDIDNDDNIIDDNDYEKKKKEDFLVDVIKCLTYHLYCLINYRNSPYPLPLPFNIYNYNNKMIEKEEIEKIKIELNKTKEKNEFFFFGKSILQFFKKKENIKILMEIGLEEYLSKNCDLYYVSNNFNLLKFLLMEYNICFHSDQWLSLPAQFACEFQSIELLKYLIHRYRSTDNYSLLKPFFILLLNLSTKKGNLNMVKYLIEEEKFDYQRENIFRNEASINTPLIQLDEEEDTEFTSLLSIAAFYGHRNLVEYFLSIPYFRMIHFSEKHSLFFQKDFADINSPVINAVKNNHFHMGLYLMDQNISIIPSRKQHFTLIYQLFSREANIKLIIQFLSRISEINFVPFFNFLSYIGVEIDLVRFVLDRWEISRINLEKIARNTRKMKDSSCYSFRIYRDFCLLLWERFPFLLPLLLPNYRQEWISHFSTLVPR